MHKICTQLSVTVVDPQGAHFLKSLHSMTIILYHYDSDYMKFGKQEMRVIGAF